MSITPPIIHAEKLIFERSARNYSRKTLRAMLKSKTSKIIIAILGCAIILFASFYEKSAGNCSPAQRTFIKKKFAGVVTGKKTLESNHMAPVIFLEGRNSYVHVYAMQETNMYSYIEEGDFLIKYKNELRCDVIRNQDTTTFFLEKPDCLAFVTK